MDGIGDRGQQVPGPPWILGHRGVPREVPENTQASLRRAVDLGLDGFAYDLRACATGELVLLADEHLEHRTDGHGLLASRTLPELFGVDAGGWFDKRFAGEPLALLDEVLELEGNQAGAWPQHLVLLREPGLVGPLAAALTGRGSRLSVRVASPRRDLVLEARDAGLPALLMLERAASEDRAWVRDERVAAVATRPGGWNTPAGRESWSSECWSLEVDDPEDLLAACRLPLNGITTREPQRALAVRALAFLTPHDQGHYPLLAPELIVSPEAQLPGPGEWCGRWNLETRVRNPFGFPVRVALDLIVRRGAFESSGLPALVELAPGAEAALPFRLTGGSWRPGGDPLLFAHYFWQSGPGRPEERLVLDAPLRRLRDLALGEGTRRLPLLRERPGDPEASLTVRRRGSDLLVAVENPGRLEEVRLLVTLDGRTRSGGRGLRLALPEDFERRPGGVPFSAGLVGRTPGAGAREGAWRLRRWAGGVSADLAELGESGCGHPGRLRPL